MQNLKDIINKKYSDKLKEIEHDPESSLVKSRTLNAVYKYQKKYGFEMPTGKESTHNNEADAFKHTYMQARESYFNGFTKSIVGGIAHELLNKNQPKGELNMDLWNNLAGQEIALEIKMKYKDLTKLLTEEQIENFIADKVMQKMNSGDLITNPNDSRKFEDYYKIKTRKGELYVRKVLSSFQQKDIPIDLLKNKKGFYSGFINSENGSDRIYSVEDMGAMSDEEFRTNKNILKAQIHKIGLPSNRELKHASIHGGGVVYVHSYTRANGTHVKSYYRSVPKRY